MSKEINWELIQAVERDICLLYYQLSEYNYIMGDLYWGSVYHLPYWEFLQVNEDEPEREQFIRDGCLVLILAMAYETIEGAGTYISDKVDKCKKAVEELNPTDRKAKKLVQAVSLALDVVPQALEAASKQQPFDEPDFGKWSLWVHREYIQGYFRGKAQEFDSNA